MATPFVPVPFPMERAQRGGGRSRPRRASSQGSATSSGSSVRDEASPPGGRGVNQAPEQAGLPPPPPPPQEQQLQSLTPLAGLNGVGPPTVSPPLSGSLESSWEERPITPTLLGYEVMEERAKFTVYKILVKRTQEENWVVFRRYTDFSRLNDKLKDTFPGFKLCLPPKRWFKDNYNTDFLEDRQLGLQTFLRNLIAHKDIANSTVVREFLCLDDPPGPFDSLEESRAFCETLEETNYRLQKELIEKQREIETLKKALDDKQLHIDVLEKRISAGNVESPCRMSDLGTVDPCMDACSAEACQEMDQENGCEVLSTSSKHTACWCGPPLGSSPPVIQVDQVLEARLEH